MRSRRQDAHGLLRGKKNSFGAKGIIGEAASWRVIDDTAFGRESRCSYLRLKLPSGIPTQVVVPSVSLAALLQGTAPTVFVETPSSATLFKPVSDPEISGPPTSRSEEHTSELQSHLNLVCRLLLEKKKKDTTQNQDAIERN